MVKKLASLNDKDDFDFSEFELDNKYEPIDSRLTELVAEKTGFFKPESKHNRRRRRESPYKIQFNIKCRIGMKELFEDVSEFLDIKNYTAFEKAFLALLEKEGNAAFLQRYNDIISSRTREING